MWATPPSPKSAIPISHSTQVLNHVDHRSSRWSTGLTAASDLKGSRLRESAVTTDNCRSAEDRRPPMRVLLRPVEDTVVSSASQCTLVVLPDLSGLGITNKKRPNCEFL